MARSFSASLASIVAQGAEQPFPALRDWSRGTFRGLRTTILPEHDVSIDQPVEVTPSTVARRERRRHLVLARRVLIAGIVALLLLAIGLVVFRGVYAGRVYPAVVVGDVPVGGLTIDQAQARLTDRAAALERGSIVFNYEGQAWTPTLTELGVTVNLDASLAQAELLGRTGNAAERLGFMAGVLNDDQTVPLQTQLDERALKSWFDTVDADIGKLPVDARVVVNGDSAAVLPGRTGVLVDREAARTEILRMLSTLEPVTAQLPTYIAGPDFDASALAPVQERVNALIAAPVAATFRGESWEIDGTTLAEFLTVDVVSEAGEPKPRLSVDTDALSRELRSRFADKVNRKPVSAVLAWDDGLVAVEPSTYGAAMKSNAFAEALAEAFLGELGTVEIPVVEIAPKIDDAKLASYGITELLGTGHSNFAGGVWERDENIRVATELMDGTLVEPGGTFSFNGAIGEITASKGYEVALVVSGDQVGRDVGGGVCQVSTTVFRAALNAGMPITEWYPHTYRLGNYERDGWGPGFDASILQYGSNPDLWPDFRFQNYSDSWLLVEAYISGDQVFVDIYGTSDGRSVEIDAYASGDNTFGFTRRIVDAQGEVIADRVFETKFKG